MLKEQDADFPGVDFFVEKLLNCANTDGDGELLLWRHADAVLGRDQSKGVALFTRAPPSLANQEAWQRKAAQFLHNGGYSQAHLTYLEFLVLEKDSQVERFHSQLATAYLDLIETERTDQVRMKFRAFVVK